MSFHLRGKTALVTGAGRGIGRAVALQLAEAGAALMITDLDRDVVFETGMLIDKAGGAVKAMPGDLTVPEFPEKLINATVMGLGSIDIVVNNAGYTWDSVIQKTTDEQFQAMLDIHVAAPFRVLRAASNWMRDTAKRETAEGQRVMRKVVNVSSISAVDGIAGQSGYGAGKAAVLGLTKVLAKEWGRYHINVNAVAFGFIETRLTQPLTDASEIEVGARKVKVGVQAAARDTAAAQCPLGRFGTPEEAAGAVMFFCSPLSDYVTGEVLVCAGGSHA